jgi:hypothetical protein
MPAVDTPVTGFLEAGRLCGTYILSPTTEIPPSHFALYGASQIRRNAQAQPTLPGLNGYSELSNVAQMPERRAWRRFGLWVKKQSSIASIL